MNDHPELDVRHHDFQAKRQSIGAALRADLDADAKRAAIECVRLLRTPMWQQGLWREFEPDVDLAIAIAAEAGLAREYGELLTYKVGLAEALGLWDDVVRTAGQAMEVAGPSDIAAEAAFHLGTALHQLGRPCEAARLLIRSLTLQSNRDHVIRVLHKYHRVLRAVGRARAAHRMLDGIIGDAPEWLYAEMLLDRASLLRRTAPLQAVACVEEARSIYLKHAFARGLAHADLEEGWLRLGLGESCWARNLLGSAEAAFTAERYRPGQVHVAYARAILARRTDAGAQQASDLFLESMNLARRIGYMNAAARAALTGLATHLRAGRIGRVRASLGTLAAGTAVRLRDGLMNGPPPRLSSRDTIMLG